ncbi:hypothetical protein TL16_g00871 [Triparma laevis f. inornata]|uniref:Beta-galactosidase n=1 Tax=Triparma laevis f. inornata TaxID=1714386 RepID=A0A9W7DQN9_9STRA|nr:hypothetical protein TL16_g00871 [Triparma laevis f. inornata]
MFGLNQDWLFQLADAPAPVKCADDAFPIDLSDKQCLGLSPALYAFDADSCGDACCSSSTCSVWQWCNGDDGDDCGDQSCWVGNIEQETDCQDQKGWLGGFRSELPPPPQPADDCDEDVMPECGQSFNDTAWRTLDIPHDFVVEGTVDQDKGDTSHGYLPVGSAWYRKHFTVSGDVKSELSYLQFEGIMGAIEIYLNGKFLISNPARYTPLRLDVTDLLAFGDDTENVLAVHVDGSDNDAWWYDGAGIYRTASIELLDRVHLANCGVYAPALVAGDIVPETEDSPATAKCQVPATVEIECLEDACEGLEYTLEFELTDGEGEVVTSGSVDTTLSGDDAVTTVAMDLGDVGSMKLWSIAHPSLYALKTSLIGSDGEVLDSSSVNFGCRKAIFDADNGFSLNDVPTKILGVANHQDLPGFGTAVPDSLQEHRVKAMQAFGSNAWRTAHNCPTSALLDATDKLGMLVWDENHHNGQTDEAITLVRRDRNHPSIIIWSICNEALCNADGNGNESPASMVAAQEIIDAYHSIDDKMNRPVSSNQNGWNTADTFLDLVGVDYAVETYDNVKDLIHNKPIISSETASSVSDRSEYINDNDAGIVIGYDTEAPSWGSTAEDAWGGVNVKNGQGILTRDFVSGGFTWTGWDYKGEPTPTSWPSVASHFGIVDSAGFWKDRTFWYKSWFDDEPELYLFPHWNWEEGEEVRMWSFSNYKEVELFVNGVSEGRKGMDVYSHVEWNVTFAAGGVEVRGYENVGDEEVAETFKIKTAGKPAKLRATIMDDVGTEGVGVDGLDIAKVKVEVLDANDVVVPVEEDAITVKFGITDNGVVVGTGNGNNFDHDPDVAMERNVYHGKVMAWIKADRKIVGVGEEIVVSVEAEGLEGDKIAVVVVDTKVRGVGEL